MKIMNILAAMLVLSGLTASSAMASVEDEIRARTAPVAEVCVEGQDCGDITTAAAPKAASSAPRSGEAVFGAVCKACHATGVAGAPVFGNKDDWAPRIKQGIDTLVSHALNGYNAMPAKGGCSSCPDEEIKNAVKYMVSEVK